MNYIMSLKMLIVTGLKGFLFEVYWVYEFSFAFYVEDYWNVFTHFLYDTLYIPVKTVAHLLKNLTKSYPKYI